MEIMEIMVSPHEESPGQAEVTEPQVISSEEIAVPGPVQCPADVNIHLVSEDDGRDGREADPGHEVAPIEPTQADAGDSQVRQDSIDSTETGSGSESHRTLDSDVSSSSTNSSSSGDDISFQDVEPSGDLVPANESNLKRARGQPGGLPLKVTLQLAFQAIGVVFGDLGASPLFVYDSALGGAGALPSEDNVLGALSLIIYTVTLVPLIKYILIVLKANDNGNGDSGETFALYSLICRCARIKVATYQTPEDYGPLEGISKGCKLQEIPDRIKEKLQKSKLCQDVLLLLAMFGTCAFIGDFVLTPSISVLWAMSGITTRYPSASEDTVTYCSAGVLVAFFCLQRFGTDRVSFLFSPVILVWFISIFALGVYHIQFYPSVFKAFNPYYIYLFFKHNKKEGWISLSGIVLAITGSESIVTDMGHFSVASIQIAFSTLVYPSLIVAYIGQAAYLIHDPSVNGATFYRSIPRSFFWPIFVIANATAIIASQGMISSTFRIIQQCMALGCFPRCKVVHTSKKFEGQIYIPEVNWILMLLTVAVTIGFKNTERIGEAYGLAVVSVMLVTTAFAALIMVIVWQKSLWLAGTFVTVFMIIEMIFYSSALYKVPQGGWVPAVFVVVVCSMMYIWHYGRKHKYMYEVQHKMAMEWALDLGSSLQTTRVQGVAFLYSEVADGVPTIFAHLVSNLKAMHSILVFICIKHLPISHVLDGERLVVCRLGPRQYHMYQVAIRYGYADQKDAGEDFERQLIDSLVRYITTEESQPVSQTDDNQDSALSDTKGVLVKQVTFQSGRDISVVFLPVPDETGGQQSAADLAMLEHSRQAGVVHLVGRTEVKAAEGSSTLRRFVIDKAYNFLRKNCRAHFLGLNVPLSRIVQIGMLQRI